METNFWYNLSLNDLEEYEQLIEALLQTRYDKQIIESEKNKLEKRVAELEEENKRLREENETNSILEALMMDACFPSCYDDYDSIVRF
jgi:vacuolar-type H+-ATPase subunit I/STV1